MRRRDGLGGGGFGYAALAVVIGFTVLALNLGSGFAIPAAITLAVGGTIVLRGPLGKALARRLEGDGASRLDEAALAELEDLRHRVLELEERQDFAERLLAQRQEPGALPDQAGPV